MRQGLPGTRSHWDASLDRDAARALSVRDVEGSGGAGHPEVDAGTVRLQRAMGMNRKQNVSHKKTGRQSHTPRHLICNGNIMILK